MPHLDTRSAGTGPKRAAARLDCVPRMVVGFHEWPKVGERHVIDGVPYSLVEISDRWVLEKMPN